MTRVYLVRHATHGLVDKALAGRMEGVHLSDEGRAQAARLGRHFADVAVDRLLSSPLERCRETAEAIAATCGRAVEIEPALNEIDCGAWTGLDFDALSDDPRWHQWNSERERHAIPEGEAVRDVQARVMPLIERLAADDHGPTVLVSHSDVIKVVALTLIGAPLGRFSHIAVDPASVTTLDLWPGGGKVVRLNQEAGA